MSRPSPRHRAGLALAGVVVGLVAVAVEPSRLLTALALGLVVVALGVLAVTLPALLVDRDGGGG